MSNTCSTYKYVNDSIIVVKVCCPLLIYTTSYCHTFLCIYEHIANTEALCINNMYSHPYIINCSAANLTHDNDPFCGCFTEAFIYSDMPRF